MMIKKFYVYILASKKDGVLYIGVTANLNNRIENHKIGSTKGFTNKYFVKKLVYFEYHDNFESAFKRESQIKAWKRKWKIELIEKCNPQWEDITNQIEF